MLAMPGLINAHFHSPGNLQKGTLDGLPLELFMLYEVPPLAAGDEADRLVYVRTQLGAIEMLRRGITTVHDDAFHVPVATEDLGRRHHAGVRRRRHARHGGDRPAQRGRVRQVPVPARDPARRRPPRHGRRAAPVDGGIAASLRPSHRALARPRERPPRRGGVVLGASARDRRLFRGPVGPLAPPRPAVQRPRAGNQAAARARRGEVRQVAGALRARPRPARRTHDGDPRHLGRRRRHRPAGADPAAPSPTTRSATCAWAAA